VCEVISKIRTRRRLPVQLMELSEVGRVRSVRLGHRKRKRAASKNGPPVHLRFRANTDVLMDLTARVSVQSPCPLYPQKRANARSRDAFLTYPNQCSGINSDSAYLF